jgi:hypothetical protein
MDELQNPHCKWHIADIACSFSCRHGDRRRILEQNPGRSWAVIHRTWTMDETMDDAIT